MCLYLSLNGRAVHVNTEAFCFKRFGVLMNLSRRLIKLLLPFLAIFDAGNKLLPELDSAFMIKPMAAHRQLVVI